MNGPETTEASEDAELEAYAREQAAAALAELADPDYQHPEDIG